jgi:hypothetical protein
VNYGRKKVAVRMSHQYGRAETHISSLSIYHVNGRAKTKINTKKKEKREGTTEKTNKHKKAKKIKMKNGAKSFGQLDIFRVAKIILGKEKAPWLE